MSLLWTLCLFISIVRAGLSTNVAVEAPGGINAAVLEKLEMYSQFAAAAYCKENNVPTTRAVACRTGNCPIVESAQVRTITGFSNTRLTDANGYLAVDPTNRQIVLAFRGSESLRNWLTDFTFLYSSTDLCPQCVLHTGFWTSWKEARSKVVKSVKSVVAQYPDYKIVVTGHSLGGALATVSAADLRKSGLVVDMYSYGAPKVAPGPGTKYLMTQANLGTNYRVTNLDDPVPRLPPSLVGFVQSFPEYHINREVKSNPVIVNDVLVYQKPFVPRGLSNIGLDVKAHVHYFGNITSCAYTEDSAGLSKPLRIPKLDGLLDDGVKEVSELLRGTAGTVTKGVGGVLGGTGNVLNGVGGSVNGLVSKLPGGLSHLPKLPLPFGKSKGGN